MIIIIPLVDDYLQLYIVEKLRFLKEHPSLIDRIFTTGKRTTLNSLKEFIAKKSVKVVIGYPKDQTSLPCYVINLAPEQEVPMGLGDGEEEFFDYEGGIGEDSSVEDIAINEFSEFINGTYMNSNYRIECWSDNGDLTSYMYIILKWALLTSRKQMLDNGWVNIRLSGTDLEPVPDYMPVFIYRRSAQINLQYENLFYNSLGNIKIPSDILEHPEKYSKDDEGNIILIETGEIVLPAKFTWLIRPHYYDYATGEEYFNSEYAYSNSDIIDKVMGQFTKKTYDSQEDFPVVGKSDVIYLVPILNSEDSDNNYEEFIYIDGHYEKIGQDLSDYATLEILKDKYKDLRTYVDNKTVDLDSLGVAEISSNEVVELFNEIF